MNRLSKIWTASIAYVALIVGAGSSVVFNILDMRSIRGAQFDGWDLFIAVLAPAMVVLMVEMFVSRLWKNLPDVAGQIIRWTVTVAIGAVAMRVSWTHGHAFLLTRDQTLDVATMWPLAIDGLAIMATALIVAGRRGHASVANSVATDGQMATDNSVAIADDMAKIRATLANQDLDLATATASVGQWDEPVATGRMATEPGAPSFTSEREYMATQPFGEPEEDVRAVLDRWEAGHQAAIDDLASTIGDEAEAFLSAGAATKQAEARVPEQARDFIANMIAQGAKTGEIDEAVQEMCMVSPRTARRYRTAVEKQLRQEGT